MKAILVLDKMPDCCGNCPLLQQWYDDEHEEWYEMCFYRYCKIEDTESKLNICPLKPLPQKDKYDVKKYATVDYENEETLGHYLNIGWNACIDEILGETE